MGVPNAVVAILSTSDPDELPEMSSGLPSGGQNCFRCEDQAEFLGPFLTGAITDATGRFEIDDNIPVGEDIVVVTMAGQFRRAEIIELPEEEACSALELPEQLDDGNDVVASGNPTRLPRDMSDGHGANIPKTVFTTGDADAMGCVFEDSAPRAGWLRDTLILDNQPFLDREPELTKGKFARSSVS